MYICWTRSCDFCNLQEISSLKVAKKLNWQNLKKKKKKNYNRGQNKMEPQIAIKDEAAQTPKRTIFPSLIWGKGGYNVDTEEGKASLVSRVSRFAEEKGKRGTVCPVSVSIPFLITFLAVLFLC